MVGLMWEVPVFTSCEQDGSLMLTQASFKLKEHIHSLVTETALKSLKCGCFYVFICLASLFVSCRILSAWSAVVFLGFYNFFWCTYVYGVYVSVYVCLHTCGHTCVQVYIHMHEHSEDLKLMADASLINLLPYSLRKRLSVKPRAHSLDVLSIQLHLCGFWNIKWYSHLSVEHFNCSATFLYLVLCFWGRASLCIPGWPPIHDPPASVTGVLGLKGVSHHIWLTYSSGQGVLTSSLWSLKRDNSHASS